MYKNNQIQILGYKLLNIAKKVQLAKEGAECFCANHLLALKWATGEQELWCILLPLIDQKWVPLLQGGRNWAGARGAPAEKFGLGRKF